MQKLTELWASPTGRGQIRHVVTLIAGYLVLRGMVPQELVDYINSNFDKLADSVGLILTVWAMAHSAKDKKTDRPVNDLEIPNGSNPKPIIKQDSL